MTARALVLLGAAAACSKAAAPVPAIVVAHDASVAEVAVPRSPIPAESTQLVTTVVNGPAATTGVLHAWHRVKGTVVWKDDGGWPVVVGRGVAWGRGLHGEGAPAGREGPVKREGDGTSPAGAFELRGAYGYAATAPAGTALAYSALDARTECVDDPRSHHYTQILERPAAGADWTSAEAMRRPDALYTWVIDIAHNPDAVRGAGSCIFFHVWRDEHSATVGCTAMPEPRVRSLLAMLAPAARPVYVLLPRADYSALQAAWGLPPLGASETVTP